MVVRVVTDSTADLSPDLVERWGITVVPLTVHFGEDTFRDGVDLGPDDFYRRLKSSSVLPRTSQPSPGVFAEVYDRLARQGNDILSVHISSKLSGTYEAALRGREETGLGDRVAVVDSSWVSLSLAIVVLEAAWEANRGAPLEKVAMVVNRTIPQIRMVGVLSTLEYLEKGGRIGKASAYLGSLLQVKPIITLRDGEVHPLEKARTWQKAVHRIFQIVAERDNVLRIGVVHSACLPEAETLARRLRQAQPSSGSVFGQFGPVLGTYTGPGALGVAWQEAS